ncbi:DNA-formamidopyrimidine glycosylase family protein [Jonesia quinghaiensis]|uniref:DNA-formamidopyrimidine glycosylase family protein n=1 Tax=Jonesia quinghaiensis TaxID=262806 RepID=UPI0003F7658C|nr:DNA-formamidopyrimidine glycosylase family protein [Jonesia quinghaiensis]
MPEGDTVLCAANRLHDVLAGAVLTRSDLRWPSAPLNAFVGVEVIEVGAYAKHMLMRCADGQTLRTHLRMDGVWRVTPTGSRESQGKSDTVRAVLGTSQWTCVGYQLGMLDVLATRDEQPLLDHLGPDILADSSVPTALIDRATSEQRLLAPRRSHAGLGMTIQGINDVGWLQGLENFSQQPPERPIGETLLDQSVVSGIGTIFMAEGLFTAKIHPLTPISQVDVPRLLSSIRGHMIRGVIQPVSGRIIHVHARRGSPCHRCGTPISRRMVGPELRQRPAFFCPTCQPLQNEAQPRR